jgi:hypothetical protein
VDPRADLGDVDKRTFLTLLEHELRPLGRPVSAGVLMENLCLTLDHRPTQRSLFRDTATAPIHIITESVPCRNKSNGPNPWRKKKKLRKATWKSFYSLQRRVHSYTLHVNYLFLHTNFLHCSLIYLGYLRLFSQLHIYMKLNIRTPGNEKEPKKDRLWPNNVLSQNAPGGAEENNETLIRNSR